MTDNVTPLKRGQLSTGVRDFENPVELWGLTGGIASGKSVVARCFQEAGFYVIDADQIAAKLRGKGGAAYDAICKRFGTADRLRLRELVFTDPVARKDLEAILHPLIYAESLRIMTDQASKRAIKKSPLPILYEAALLVETGRYKSPDFTGLIVVDAPRELRRKRLIERDGTTPELADQMLGAQVSDETRLAAATVILVNDGSLEDMRTKVKRFIQDRGWKV